MLESVTSAPAIGVVRQAIAIIQSPAALASAQALYDSSAKPGSVDAPTGNAKAFEAKEAQLLQQLKDLTAERDALAASNATLSTVR